MRTTDIPTVVLVASGKGGVGKTQVSVDLSRALAADGHTVGFLDADVSTPNAPEALAGDDYDYSRESWSTGEYPRPFRPIDVDGVHVFSQGLLLADGKALLRDAEWHANRMRMYVETIEWPDDTEYLVVDSAPGNGSEVQTVIAELTPDHGFLVTTGAVHSARDTRRTRELFVDAGIPHSVIANMRRVAYDIDYDAIAESVQNIHGIADAKAERITEIARDTIGGGEMPLHDDDIDLADRIGADVAADVPFTTDRDRRHRALAGAIDALPQPMVVE